MTLGAFLLGFLPALPPAVLAARARLRGRPLRAAAWDVAGFAVYFWASSLGIGWKTAGG